MFNNKEKLMLLLTAFISAFILTFDKWGIETFDLTVGLKNILIALIIVAVSLWIKIYIQKYYSRKMGFNAEFKPWIIGFIIGVFIIFVTNGNFIFLAFGGLTFGMIEKLRMGKDKTYLSPIVMGWLSMIGPITLITIALIAKIILANFGGDLLANIIIINIWLAAYSLVPLPFVHRFKIGSKKEFGTSDGLKLLFAAPLQYFIVTILLVIDMFVISLSTASNAFITTLITFLIIFLIYYLFYRQHLSRGVHGIYKYRFE